MSEPKARKSRKKKGAEPAAPIPPDALHPDRTPTTGDVAHDTIEFDASGIGGVNGHETVRPGHGSKSGRKEVKLSIRDFAMPAPRTGSIDSMSGYGRSSLEGIELHQLVQGKRENAFPEYRAEVKTTHTFSRGEYDFVVEGRLDGIFDGDPPKIEEIKSTFNIDELNRVLQRKRTDHPYNLQLLTYGYFHFKETGVTPELTFHLISTRNRATLDLEVSLDVPEYETWLERRLIELENEAIAAEKRAARRRKVAAKFPFPFEKPRPGQVDLIATIEETQKERKRLLVQAPTGLGKTAGVLYPSMKEALSRGQRTIYATPKNSQHSVAEDAIERFQDTGSAVKSLTITAKAKMCLKAEPLCNPTYCEFARDYYDKVAAAELPALLARKKKLSSRLFKQLGEEHEVCPFELQFEAAQEADAIICDYNYVFAAQSALSRVPTTAFTQEGKPNLVIDEAHNLPSRAMQYYSPQLSAWVLNQMREPLRELPKTYAREAELLLDECIKVVRECAPGGVAKAGGGEPRSGGGGSGGNFANRGDSMKIDPPVHPFEEQDEMLRSFLSRYLDSDVEIQPRDPVLALCFYWSEFTGVLAEISGAGRPEFFVTFQSDRGPMNLPTVKITCCDASQMLKPCYDEYDNVVAFSATLKPFEYYAELTGLKGDDLRTAEFSSPFARSHRKLLVIPQVSTKYSQREKNYGRIAESISRISAVKSGNYFAFFPSFDFMERVLATFAVPPGFKVVRQERNMRVPEIEGVLEDLRSQAQPTIVFAVQGGVFSEGVDYPGKMIIGAFVVGPPLPNFDLERETMRKYYDEYYRSGFDYAYAYPAMAKAVQAAGRVIRSESDKGIIVLLDNRFLEDSYSKSMPSDWYDSSPLELVSNSILKDVEGFWKKASDSESQSSV
jgi:DNA excision repair protein ERCC-2